LNDVRGKATTEELEVAIEITPVWKQVTPELKAELLAMWERNQAMRDPAQASVRADQAVCIGRDGNGALCAVGTAVVRVLPRLRQPMYYYRQFFSQETRGQRQTVPFFVRAREILQDYNTGLPKPESLGLLMELENPQLAARYNSAEGAAAGTTFIGYSPRGMQLRVSYFEGATLLPPVDLPRRQGAMAGRRTANAR
jgi:hypothetical protein